MFTIRQPSQIIFGKFTAREFSFPKNSLIITSRGAESRNWFSYMNIEPNLIFNSVEPNPSMDTVEKIISNFKNKHFDCFNTHVCPCLRW